jgi:hypothetical protein
MNRVEQGFTQEYWRQEEQEEWHVFVLHVVSLTGLIRGEDKPDRPGSKTRHLRGVPIVLRGTLSEAEFQSHFQPMRT